MNQTPGSEPEDTDSTAASVLAEAFGVSQHRLEAAIAANDDIRADIERIKNGDTSRETINRIHFHTKQWLMGER